MTGNTHRLGGLVMALAAFELMRAKGWMMEGVNDYIQLAIMYPAVSWGSIFPDLDHGKDSIPTKEPLSRGVNWVLRQMGAKHRSWQTHSILVTGGFCLLLYAMVGYISVTTGSGDIGWEFVRLSVVGFTAGVLSHLILDSITPQGVHMVPGKKIRFVPSSGVFATGGGWERIVFKVMTVGVFLQIIRIAWVQIQTMS